MSGAARRPAAGRSPAGAARPLGRAAAVLATGVVLAALAGCGRGRPAAGPTPTSARPTPSVTATGPGGGPVGVRPAADFAPAVASFVGAQLGFALGTVPCLPDGTTLCPSLLRTADGGASWAALSPPPLLVLTGRARPLLTFADALDGYAADGRPGSPLAVTHDGGRTWRLVKLAGAPSDTAVTALAADGGRVVAVAGDARGQRLYVAAAAEGTPAPTGPALPGTGSGGSAAAGGSGVSGVAGGSGGATSLALAGGGGWVTVSRSGAEPAYLRSGVGHGWTATPSPCVAGQTATVAASDAAHVTTLCQGPVSSDPATSQTATRIAWRSTDGGAAFTTSTDVGGEGVLVGLAAPSPTSVVLATDGTGDRLLRSGDRSGTTVLTYASSVGGAAQGLLGLAFADATHGSVVLGTTASYARQLASGGKDVPTTRLLLTVDGGAHWGQAIFRP